MFVVVFVVFGWLLFVVVDEGLRVFVLFFVCEVLIVLSVVFEYLQEDVGVFVFMECGYEIVWEVFNLFICVVNCDYLVVFKLMCFDEEGMCIVVLKICYVGDQLFVGVGVDVFWQDFVEKFRSGVFELQGCVGVVYMFFCYNCLVNLVMGEFGFFLLYVMFYVLNLMNEDIGYDMVYYDLLRLLLMIVYGGLQGYMIMILDDGKERLCVDFDVFCLDWVFDLEWVFEVKEQVGVYGLVSVG